MSMGNASVIADVLQFPSTRNGKPVSTSTQCAGHGVTCRHRVVWRIVGEGYYCNGCYEVHFATHWRDIDVQDIKRLSDREEDFFGSNGGG